MNKTRIIHLITLIVMILLFTIPTHAQDATQEATVEAAPVSVVGEGTVINVNPSNPTETPSDGSPLAVLFVIATGFVGVIVAISFGLQAIGQRAQAAVTNPLEIAVLEKGYDSIPSAVVNSIIEPLKQSLERSDEALQQVISLMREMSDKTPKASKPATYPPATGTPLGTEFTQTSTANLPQTGPLGTGGASTGDGSAFPKP
jgi:hypothetical protein